MGGYTTLCKNCNALIQIEDEIESSRLQCKVCQVENTYNQNENYGNEIDFYPISPPYAYISIRKDSKTLKKKYVVLEPILAEDEQNVFLFIKNELLNRFSIRLDELDIKAISFLHKEFFKVLKEYSIDLNPILQKKFLYYYKRIFLGYEKIDALMHDPNIEDISCDGSNTSIFIHHREYGSIETSIIFNSDEELSKFVVRLAQKCGKHISVSKPMIDATMPDGSRIQMTLSSEITTKGSTFTIRRFRSDPITPIDLIKYNTVSAEILAYLWMTVEYGSNALIAGETASGKTSILNAICLFIPKESKIVSIEETREINLPHPNWIPGVARSGLGEVVHNNFVGEIDLFDLMKAALRQRPEYILVGEIRGQEAYVLFQAMATGHTTYSTVHADSMQSLIHRLEGKPINVPRNMMQSLDIVLLQTMLKMNDKNVRRSKEIVEVITVDAETREFLTNSVFKWDSTSDRFIYTGKSFILEKIREQIDLSKDAMSQEIKNRERILQWMTKYDIRDFSEVGRIVSMYKEKPKEIMKIIENPPDSKYFSQKKFSVSGSDDTSYTSSLLDDINEFNENDFNEPVKEKQGFLKKIMKKKG